jgi:hypothetical protein
VAHGFAEARWSTGNSTRIPTAGNAQSFFDPVYYLSQNPNVVAGVRDGAFVSAYEHFRRFGQFEGRQPSSQFNERFYLYVNPDLLPAIDAGTVQTGFQHFVAHGFSENRSGTGFFNFTPVSGNARSFFDPAFYLSQNRDVSLALRNRSIRSAFEHFLRFGQHEGRRPSAVFNESAYRAANADVRAAIAAGKLRSGFQHFVAFGFAEGRSGI